MAADRSSGINSREQRLEKQLSDLNTLNQTLLQEATESRQRFEKLQTQIEENKREMADNHRALLDARVVSGQRTTAQSDFWTDLNSNNVLIRGLHDAMDDDAGLKAAIAAVVGKNSTDAQRTKLLFAIATEMSGDPDKILQLVARKVTQFQNKQTGVVAAAANPFVVQDTNEIISINDDDDDNNDDDDDDEEDDDGDDYDTGNDDDDDDEDDVVEQPSARRARAPPIKVDPDTFPAFSVRNLINNEKLHNNHYPERGSFRHAMAGSTTTPISGKRARSEASETPRRTPSLAGSATKKLKSGKDIVFAPALINFLEKVQTTHRAGRSIDGMIRCGKCNEIKRDARVLNCNHVYCHRCIQKLRIEAERGDALLGFRPYCMQPNCNEVVSGKTAVVFAEVMELLIWYDNQARGVNNIDCKMHMLNKAKEKKPTDSTIKNLLAEVAQAKTAEFMAGNASEACDLLEMTRFARKWLVAERAIKE